MILERIDRAFLDRLFTDDFALQLMNSPEVVEAQTSVFNLIDRVIYIKYTDNTEVYIQTHLTENLNVDGIYIEGRGIDIAFLWPFKMDIDLLIERFKVSPNKENIHN